MKDIYAKECTRMLPATTSDIEILLQSYAALGRIFRIGYTSITGIVEHALHLYNLDILVHAGFAVYAVPSVFHYR